MVRLLAAVLGAALLSSSTLAAPARGMHRRTMVEEQPATSMMQEEPPIMSDAPEPPMMGEEPPVSSEMMEEPPVSTGMMDEPPAVTMDEPPAESTPVMEEPPMSEPPMSEPPMSEPPMSEPPMSEPPMSEPPVSEPPMSEPPMSEPPMSEPPMSEPPMSEPPVSEPPMSEPPMSEPPMSEPPMSEPPMSEPPKPEPSYGSGSNPWSPTYDDCVQKCIADYGAPKESTWTPPPKESQAPDAKPTHTVMVAPVDGVPRFMPFALNATVGDTVRFIWTGQNEHSTTMSSALSVCNKSEEAGAFDSELLSGKDGEKTFDVEVKTDQPMWFYCKFGQHCSQGMFGGINLKSAFGDPNSVGVKMDEWVQGNPDLQAAWTYVQNKTAGTPAEKWGNSISVADIPEDKYVDVAQNILWTRVNLAANPGMQEMGSAQTPDNSPLKLVGDISTLLAESNSQVVEGPGSSSSEPSGSAPAPAAPTESQKSGALPSYSPAAVVSVLALLASVLLI